MSNAKSMGELARARRYTEHRLKWTGPMCRRYWHKILHAEHPTYESIFDDVPPGMRPKDQPTTRRKDAVAARRARRA
jgi:hypothetical protein